MKKSEKSEKFLKSRKLSLSFWHFRQHNLFLGPPHSFLIEIGESLITLYKSDKIFYGISILLI